MSEREEAEKYCTWPLNAAELWRWQLKEQPLSGQTSPNIPWSLDLTRTSGLSFRFFCRVKAKWWKQSALLERPWARPVILPGTLLISDLEGRSKKEHFHTERLICRSKNVIRKRIFNFPVKQWRERKEESSIQKNKDPSFRVNRHATDVSHTGLQIAILCISGFFWGSVANKGASRCR